MFWTIVITLTIYFLPSICAVSEHKKNTFAIIVANVLLGWTVIGWILILVWGCMKD